MESKEGRSQELSKARTRLTFPRGRVVQPPLQPGINPDPPPPCSGESDPPCAREPRSTRHVGKAGSSENGFSPRHSPLARALRTPRTVKHPETSLRAPKSDSSRNFSCGRAPSRRRVPRALSCACARLLSHPRQKNKENLTGWQPALIVPPPLFPSPWHCPAIQPDCLSIQQTTLRSPPRS